jgi:hypothetical protein
VESGVEVTAMLKRLALVLVVVLIVVGVLSEFFLPGLLARGVEQALETTFGPAGDHRVRLRSYPAVRMLLGHFDDVTITSTNVETSTISLEALAVTLEDASVDLRALLAGGDLRVTRSQKTRVTITITQRNLEAYLARNVPGFGDPRVLITPEFTVISGYLTVLEREFLCSLSGRFVLADPKTVSFRIEGFSVDDVIVPTEFLETWLELLGRPDLSLDLTAFPLPLTGTEVVAEDGQMVIKATSGQ